MDITTSEILRYFYTIYGTIPELTPDIAYRHESRTIQRDRKILKCPHCDKRLTDTDVNTRVELYQHPVRVRVQCQFYLKCFHCGSEVGINLAINN